MNTRPTVQESTLAKAITQHAKDEGLPPPPDGVTEEDIAAILKDVLSMFREET